MENIEKLKSYYKDITFRMGELNDKKQALKDAEDEYTKDLHAISINDKNFDNISDKLKENQYNKKLNETMINILLQDVLYIQQQLLLHASEFIKNSKYFGKPFGEKTKEKMQDELKQYLTDAMGGITIYCYISRKQDSWDDLYEISIYFEDFYYEYNLKQEYIRINTKDKSINGCGYYGAIDFIDFVGDNLGIQAVAMLNLYNASIEEVKELEKQLDAIKEKNNKGKTAFLYDLRITEYITRH